MPRISDRDVAMMLQIVACDECKMATNPSIMRQNGACLCGCTRSSLRMINKTEVQAFLGGRLHASVLWDGRCNPVELNYGINDVPPAVIDYYRDGLEKLMIDEEQVYAKDMLLYRREHLNPVREDWRVIPQTARRLINWVRLKARKKYARRRAASGS